MNFEVSENRYNFTIEQLVNNTKGEDNGHPKYATSISGDNLLNGIKCW